MSSRSASSNISDKSSVKPRKSSVSRNSAKDDAFQINIGYMKVDKLFISGAQFSLTSASRTLESFRLGVLSSDDARPVIGLQKEERKDLESIPLPKQQPDMKWMTTSKKGAISTPPGRYAQLYNNLSGKYAVVFVKLDASTGDAYIARRIVNRFGLSTSGYNPISACGSFVDLICEPTPGKAHKLYRFRILDTCLFDICAGLGLHPCS